MKTAFFSLFFVIFTNFQLFSQAILVRVLPKNEPLRAVTRAVTPDGKILIVQTWEKDELAWYKTTLVNDSTCTPLEKLKITTRKYPNGASNNSISDFYFTPDMNFLYYKLSWTLGDKKEIMVIKYDLKNNTEQEIKNRIEYPAPYQNIEKPLYFRSKEGKKILKRTFKDGKEVKPEVVIDYPLQEGAITGIEVEQILAKGKLLLLGIGGCCSYNSDKKSRAFTPIQYYFSRLIKGKMDKTLPN